MRIGQAGTRTLVRDPTAEGRTAPRVGRLPARWPRVGRLPARWRRVGPLPAQWRRFGRLPRQRTGMETSYL
eukprot:6662448-Prymnesium_polylepis.1